MPDITIPLWAKILVGLLLAGILASVIYSMIKIGVLRTIGVVFMSLTALFTILGGAGTSCAAINPTNPRWADSLGPLAKAQWLYILFVLVTVAIGVMGVRAVVLLIQGKKNAYRYSLIALISGTVVGIIHIAASRILRGSSTPVDMVVYVTVLTLILFLIFRIPGIWKHVDFENPKGGKKGGQQAAAIALGACGVLTLSIQFLMAPTHTFSGVNYADVWHVSLTLLGGTLILVGIVAALYSEFAVARRQVPVQTD